MPDATLRIEGLEEFQDALRRFPDEIHRAVKAEMPGANDLVRNELATYPPASGANSPPGINGYSWYERGFGTRTVTGRAYATSEALGRSWTTTVEGGGGTIRGIIGTNASYADYVQGPKQASFHKPRGWLTVEQVLDTVKRDIETFFGRVIERVLARLAR